jgi:uncharacterized protein (DUF2062 family)
MRIAAPLTRKGRWRQMWHAIIRALRGVVLLEDTPHRIAIGSAAGIFSGFLPIFGQTFIGMILARILRGNVFASIPWSWLSNPFTTLPIWYAGYLVGVWLWPGREPALSYQDIAAVVDRFSHASIGDGLPALLGILGDLLGPMWLGTSVLGILFAVPGYFAVAAAVRWQQRRLRQRQAQWQRGPT